MRKILQIIPAQPGTRADFTTTYGKHKSSVVCWALAEWYEDEGVTSSVEPMVIWARTASLTIIADIRELKSFEGFETPESE